MAKELKFSQGFDAKTVAIATLAVAAAVAVPDLMAVQGGLDTEFQATYEKICTFMTGYAGKTICLTIAIIGLVQGIKAGSMWAFVIAFFAAIGFTNAKGILETAMGAPIAADFVNSLPLASDVAAMLIR